MHRKIKVILTIGFCIFMFCVYISNNAHLESFARKIEREMIIPYSQRFSSMEEMQPINAPEELVEETPEPTIEEDEEPPVTIIYVTPTPADISISEAELWEALTSYRNMHDKSTIEKAESLCTYARYRATELYERLQTNPDDPLDGHAGFSRDADSGYVFEVTGYNTVGENLAYTPGYTNATQIIEWGWDTSPGHRSLQLSEDVTHGCISGVHPIYVGIFTY